MYEKLPQGIEPPPLRRLNLNLLYALDAILNSQSLTDAGRRVLLSQPAMSLSLRKLREQFNDDLVGYVGNERVLTSLANALRPKVRQLLVELDETFSFRLNFDPRSARLTFRIAAPEAVEILLLGRVIPKLLAQAPFIGIEVLPLDLANPVAAFENGADVAVMPARFADERFATRHLLNETLSCMVWEDHPIVGDEITIEIYEAARHAAVFDMVARSIAYDRSTRNLLDKRRIAVRTARYAALPGLAIGTDLVVTASGWLLQHFASMMPLRVVPFPCPTPEEAIAVQWPHHRDGDPARRWLVEQMSDLTQDIGPRAV